MAERKDRRVAWQERQKAKGNCIVCGKPKNRSKFKDLCSKHGLQRRRKRRKATGSKAWKPGGPGRPPYSYKGK